MMQCQALTNFNPLQESQNLNQLSANIEIGFALQRMYKNILLINSGINSKIINVSNTTLFQVAADQYQDATLWSYLAQVNNLLDFEISTPMSLTIPTKPSVNMEFGT
jgi:hypothetical protein